MEVFHKEIDKSRVLVGGSGFVVFKRMDKDADLVRLVKAMVFPVIMYGWESWTIKKAERWRIDAFELWCWKRLLRVPWTARSNQSILKEISPDYSLKGLMLKLKLQYFGYLMRRADSLAKTLMLRKTEGRRRRGWQRMRRLGWHPRLDGHEFEQALGVGDGQGSPCYIVHRVAKSQIRLSGWTEEDGRLVPGKK